MSTANTRRRGRRAQGAGMSATKILAVKRLARDLREYLRNPIPSIGAAPMERNMFEWHCNLKPVDGPLSTIFVHLILTFPDDYPNKPPRVRCATHFAHPNVFGGFICLSLLRDHTTGVPYEGWSAAYSVSSVLRQLQTFLFSESVPQDGGYYVKAYSDWDDVRRTIESSTGYHCRECGHSHYHPFPPVSGVGIHDPNIFETQSCVKMQAMSSEVSADHCFAKTDQSLQIVSARSTFGVDRTIVNRVVFEATIIRCGGICRFGWGNARYTHTIGDGHSFGYGDNGKFSHNGSFSSVGPSFTTYNTITCAIDFERNLVYFAKEGRLIPPVLRLPRTLRNVELYPMVSFTDARVAFNFGRPKKPIPQLRDFATVNEAYESVNNRVTVHTEEKQQLQLQQPSSETRFDMRRMYADVWLSIFQMLPLESIHRLSKVCQEWKHYIDRYNLIERSDFICYHSKRKLFDDNDTDLILGTGFEVSQQPNGRMSYVSKMDILSLQSFQSGVRYGVWSEPINFFLPLIVNREHSERASATIFQRLGALINNTPINEMETVARCRLTAKQILRGLAAIMNSLVVDFVMSCSPNAPPQRREASPPAMYGHMDGPSTVETRICEKILFGYTAMHHLLLWIADRDRTGAIVREANKMVSDFVNHRDARHKQNTPDLGQWLIYALMSDYPFGSYIHAFVKESFSRRALWMVKRFPFLNTMRVHPQRVPLSIEAGEVGMRLVIFQTFFLRSIGGQRSNAQRHAAMVGYHNRLGRPTLQQRTQLTNISKFLKQPKISYVEFFNAIGCQKPTDMEAYLRTALKSSHIAGYHRIYDGSANVNLRLAPQNVDSSNRRCVIRRSNPAPPAQLQQSSFAAALRPPPVQPMRPQPVQRVRPMSNLSPQQQSALTSLRQQLQQRQMQLDAIYLQSTGVPSQNGGSSLPAKRSKTRRSKRSNKYQK